MKVFKKYISWIVFCIFLPIAATYAEPAYQNPIVQDQPEFDFKVATKEFDQLNLHLSTENLNIDHLLEAIDHLNDLIAQANDCISFNQKKVSSLDALITETAHIKDSTKAGADLIYLNQEKKKITSRLAQCRLFAIRAQEAITTFQATVTKLKQQQVLARGLPLWTLINDIQKTPHTALLPKIKSWELPQINHGLALLLSSLGLSGFIAFLLIKKIKTHNRLRQHLRVKKIGFAFTFLWFVCLFCSFMTLWIIGINLPIPPLALNLTLLFCGYLWALIFITGLFKINIFQANLYRYALDSRFFKNLLVFLLTYYTLTKMAQAVLQTLAVNDLLWQLGQLVFLSVVIFIALGFFYYFCKTHAHTPFIRNHQTFLKRAILLLFFSCIMVNIFGYHQLAMNLTFGWIMSFVIIFTLFLVEHSVQKLYWLCTNPGPMQSAIVRIFGYRPDQTPLEFGVLKTTLQAILFFAAIYFIISSWGGYGTIYMDMLYTTLINGVHIGSIVLYPTRIVMGILVFCLLYLLFRGIATQFSRHSQSEEEEETQVALASILTYVGFTCALVIALFISGIDFTGLAIVAGALSVGIGLGLQSIVNNFVSGLILLIEKPIKPGDRVSIGDVEGIVKKIRVRSTQITTPSREDIIIPNSDLITRPVTNFMFSDRYLSISCEVSVDYDTDPQLVKKLLLQAASEHDDILKSSRAKPSVLLQKFGDSGMLFQVSFVIKDANKKSNVHSEVNFSIDRLFREHHIKFSYPKRDINVKLSQNPA